MVVKTAHPSKVAEAKTIGTISANSIFRCLAEVKADISRTVVKSSRENVVADDRDDGVLIGLRRLLTARDGLTAQRKYLR